MMNHMNKYTKSLEFKLPSPHEVLSIVVPDSIGIIIRDFLPLAGYKMNQ